jgi:hypothetical protein
MWMTVGVIFITGGGLLLGSTVYDVARRKVRGMMLVGRVLIGLNLIAWGYLVDQPGRPGPTAISTVSVVTVVALFLITRARANAEGDGQSTRPL